MKMSIFLMSLILGASAYTQTQNIGISYLHGLWELDESVSTDGCAEFFRIKQDGKFTGGDETNYPHRVTFGSDQNKPHDFEMIDGTPFGSEPTLLVIRESNINLSRVDDGVHEKKVYRFIMHVLTDKIDTKDLRGRKARALVQLELPVSQVSDYNRAMSGNGVTYADLSKDKQTFIHDMSFSLRTTANFLKLDLDENQLSLLEEYLPIDDLDGFEKKMSCKYDKLFVSEVKLNSNGEKIYNYSSTRK
jgi:hypothetical protein